MSQKLKANLCRNMQPLVGLWQTSEGFTSAACDQTIQQQHTIGLLSVFAVLFCHIKTTFPIGSDSPSPARMGGEWDFTPLSRSDPARLWRVIGANTRRASVKCEDGDVFSGGRVCVWDSDSLPRLPAASLDLSLLRNLCSILRASRQLTAPQCPISTRDGTDGRVHSLPFYT